MSIQQYLPSKEFRKRVIKITFLLFIVVIIRFGAYPFIKGLFEKNKIPDNITVKQFVDIDTDNDKVPDWEEAIWGTDPKMADSNNDGISDYDYISSRKQGLNEPAQNETTILSAEVMQTLFALIGKKTVTKEALANLGTATGQSIIKPELTNTYTASSFNVVSTNKADVKNYYIGFGKASNSFAKSKAPDEFEILSVAISSEDPSQLIDLDQTIKKYSDFEKGLLKLKVPSDILLVHTTFTNSLASIVQSLEKSKLLYTNSVVGINGIIELRLAHSKLDEQVVLLRSYFLRNGLIE